MPHLPWAGIECVISETPIAARILRIRPSIDKADSGVQDTGCATTRSMRDGHTSTMRKAAKSSDRSESDTSDTHFVEVIQDRGRQRTRSRESVCNPHKHRVLSPMSSRRQRLTLNGGNRIPLSPPCC
jgi:hypothetical protein